MRAVPLATCSAVQPTPAALPDLPQVPVSGANAHSPDEPDYPYVNAIDRLHVSGKLLTISSYLAIFRSTSRIGVPGTPGTVDLTNALRRLSPRDRLKSEGGNCSDGYGWRTPDSIMSTGSCSAFTSLSLHYPEKLKIIKPIEGSTTLHHWSRLATVNCSSIGSLEFYVFLSLVFRWIFFKSCHLLLAWQFWYLHLALMHSTVRWEEVNLKKNTSSILFLMSLVVAMLQFGRSICWNWDVWTWSQVSVSLEGPRFNSKRVSFTVLVLLSAWYVISWSKRTLEPSIRLPLWFSTWALNRIVWPAT